MSNQSLKKLLTYIGHLYFKYFKNKKTFCMKTFLLVLVAAVLFSSCATRRSTTKSTSKVNANQMYKPHQKTV